MPLGAVIKSTRGRVQILLTDKTETLKLAQLKKIYGKGYEILAKSCTEQEVRRWENETAHVRLHKATATFAGVGTPLAPDTGSDQKFLRSTPGWGQSSWCTVIRE